MTRIGKALCFPLWALIRVAGIILAVPLILMAIHNNPQFMADEEDEGDAS